MKTAAETVVSLEGLHVGYGVKPVLDGIVGQVGRGSFVCLLGPNGAGKTTLLKTLARLLPPLGGKVLLCGDDLQGLAQEEAARRQAVVLTHRPSPGFLTAFELTALGRSPHTGLLGRLDREDREQTRRALELVGASHLAERYVDQLSDGERQKVMLARALAQAPQVILLDEPTMHLDLKHRIEVMSILHGLCRRQGITVIASLHDVDMAARVSDQVVLVRDGGVMAWGPPESVLDQEAVARLYDLGAARFSRELGIIEMNNHCRYGPVFVIPGGGSAVGLLRLLYKRGFAMAGGVVHRNDVDYYIGASLGVEMVVEEPFEAISEQNHRQAQASLEQVETVADAGFPVNKVNRSNLELLRCALRMGKRVFSLRRPEHAAALLGPDADRLCYCPDELSLADGLLGEVGTTVGRR